MKYQIWYMTSKFFRHGSLGKLPEPINLSATHVHLRNIEETSLERAWALMQGEVCSPNSETRQLIEAKGLGHMSMTLGDVIVDDAGMAYVVTEKDCNSAPASSIAFKAVGYISLRKKIRAEKIFRQSRYLQTFKEVFDKADHAGFAAAETIMPIATVNEGSPALYWIKIHPTNCSFAKWLVKNGHARKNSRGGVSIPIEAHRQSIERKEAHARKMAEVLKEKLGLERCYVESRLDEKHLIS